MNRRVLLSLGLWTVAVGTLAVVRYPPLLAALAVTPLAVATDRPEQYILPTVVFGPAPIGSSTTSVYRGGPGRTGEASARPSRRLRTEWCRRPLNVGVHGASKSSPAVDASGVYVGTDSGFLLAVDHAGNLRWSVHLPDSARGIHATAVVDADTVYIGAYNGVLYAVDKATGAFRWSKKIGDAIGSSAVLHAGAIYVTVETNHPDGYLVKLDARDGRLIWASDWLDEQSHSSPTLAPEFDTVLIGSNAARFAAFAMSDGRPKWSRVLLAPMKGTALVVDRRVIFSSWEKRTLALDLATGHQLWSFAQKGPSQVSPSWARGAGAVVVGDGTGEIVALDLVTGRVKWRRDANVARHQASAVITRAGGGRDVVWALCRAHALCALDASSGRVLSETPLDANFSGQPVPCDGAMYVALDGTEGGLCKWSAAP